MIRQAARESAFILCAAVLLGFTFSLFAGKGVFAPSGSFSAGATSRTASPPSPINVAEAKMLFESNTALFVDARHDFDFRRGHIKSAISLPLNEFDARQSTIAALPKDKVIIVYCDGAECNSSIELAAKLYDRGFSGVRFFPGGWEDWTSNNLPTEASK
ncbi:MAG TPA: rhodanese-like domain-containing protein [Bacteroidota bacterium]